MSDGGEAVAHRLRVVLPERRRAAGLPPVAVRLPEYPPVELLECERLAEVRRAARLRHEACGLYLCVELSVLDRAAPAVGAPPLVRPHLPDARPDFAVQAGPPAPAFGLCHNVSHGLPGHYLRFVPALLPPSRAMVPALHGTAFPFAVSNLHNLFGLLLLPLRHNKAEPFA